MYSCDFDCSSHYKNVKSKFTCQPCNIVVYCTHVLVHCCTCVPSLIYVQYLCCTHVQFVAVYSTCTVSVCVLYTCTVSVCVLYTCTVCVCVLYTCTVHVCVQYMGTAFFPCTVPVYSFL